MCPQKKIKIQNRSNLKVYVILIIQAIIVLLPFIWLLFSSLKSNLELTFNVWGFPKHIELSNYVVAVTQSHMGTYMFNSLIVAILSLIITVSVCTPIAFVLARFRFKLNRFIFYLILAGMMIPIHSVIIPLYILAFKLDLQNNLIALSFMYAAFRIPFSVFILEGFMSTIPRELEESSIIDGCSTWKMFTHVVFPLSRDGIATISILTVLSSWNEFLVAMLMLNKVQVRTLPIGLKAFVSEFGIAYGQLSAGLILAIVPSIIFFMLLQKFIVKGLIAGAIKG